MKNGNVSFLLLVLICLLGYNIYSTKQLKTDVEMYNQKIDSIQHNIDSVVLVNKNLDILTKFFSDRYESETGSN